MALTYLHLRHFFNRLHATRGISRKAKYIAFACRRAVEIAAQRSPTKSSTVISSAVRRADNIGYIYNMHLDASLNATAPSRLNFLIPALDPSIIFGGYLSYFQFADYCSSQGASLRFIVTERFHNSLSEVIDRCKLWFPNVAQVLVNAEIVDYTTETKPHLTFSPRDIIVAYSCVNAVIAHNTVKQLSLRPFIFYIQEEEGHFFAHNSMRAFIESVYCLPHTAIFNSSLLENYYRQNKIGVFAEGSPPGKSVNFRHALTVNRVPTVSELIGRRPRKLLFFARPEQHAERNLFELGLVALRCATYINLFPKEEWLIHAIGTDKFADEQLYNGQKVEFIGRFPLAEYGRRLADYDIGLSLMYAPHPSVPNFEMAASGLVTVTTEFSNRCKAEMERLCPNFIVSKPSIDSLVEALAQAVIRSGACEARNRNAHFDWPRSWEESFGPRFSSDFARMLALNYPSIDKIFPLLSPATYQDTTLERSEPPAGRRGLAA